MVTLEACDNLQATIDAVPEFGRAIINLPDGDFYLDTITIINRGIVLRGGEKTTLHFKGTGIVIDRTWSGAGRVELRDINLVGTKDVMSNGIEVHAVTNIMNCSVTGFGGTGVYISADLNDNKRNASHSQLNTVLSQQCGTGFYIHGGDANQICFYSCDARDNDGWGFDDESFLGCQFFGCMAHANKGGHYKAGGANNRSTFIGCYGEGDSPKNWMTCNATVIGGLIANGFDLFGNASVISGKNISNAKFGTIEFNSEGIIFLQEKSGSFPFLLKQVKGEALPHFSYGDQHEFFSGTKNFASNYSGRKVTFSSDGFKTFFIGSRLFAEGKPGDKRFDGFVFKAGDTLLNPDYDGTNIERWVYKQTWEAVV